MKKRLRGKPAGPWRRFSKYRSAAVLGHSNAADIRRLLTIIRSLVILGLLRPGRARSVRNLNTPKQRFPVRELATGKSPEPADKNVCATSLGADLANGGSKSRVALIHPDVFYHVLLGQLGVVNRATPVSAQRKVDQ